MKRISIRRQLLVLFVPFVFGLWIASAALSFWLVDQISGDAFDKDLINSADSVIGRLRVKDGKVVADLPPAAQAILKHDESDKLYYRVVGIDGRHISGDTVVPSPVSDLEVDIPKVVSGIINGKEVRIAEIKVPVDEGGQVIVQLAETTNIRHFFQNKLLLSIAVPQLLVIVLAMAAVFYGIDRILTPLRMLQKQLAGRSQADFSPLPDSQTPEEVFPLVSAINKLFQKTEEKIKAHQRFIANAAHQLRTPLAGLKTYTSIGPEMTEVAELRSVVTELDRGVDRATRMVSQLLALARTDGRADNSTSHLIDLNFLVSDVVNDLVQQAVMRGVNLSFEAAPTAANVLGEEASLTHLAVNLVENAILYTPAQGRVNVRLLNNGRVKLIVSDTGPGISPEERDNIFERFYRVVGTNGDGSGLGLSIVKEVANAHDAIVTVETGPGGSGTSFVVEFAREIN